MARHVVTLLLLVAVNPISNVECAVQFITCGSVLKLINVDYKVRLHSHDVKYGTGSGQQSVTATQQQEDTNSHWVIKGPTKKFCVRGEPIKCGETIRLEHLTTSKNLHSHRFSSPLSGNQEVSAYGTNGEGDTGDHWTVICDGDYWERDEKVILRHVDTDVYLSVSGQVYNRPINGQMEVVGTTRLSSAYWKAAEGLYIHKSDFNPIEQATQQHVHTELFSVHIKTHRLPRPESLRSAEFSGVGCVVSNGGSNVSLPMLEASSGNVCIWERALWKTQDFSVHFIL